MSTIQPQFAPVFIRSSDYANYGLPSVADVPVIDRLVIEASKMIDEFCGRTSSGMGSLAYSTYQERCILVGGYNLFRVSQRPMIGISASTQTDLIASGAISQGYYSGFQANTVPDQINTLSPLLSVSGRYGYRRKGDRNVYPDLGLGMNPLLVASAWGGPPQWTGIDIALCDVDVRTGECWVPAGLLLAQYSEVLVTYNSGYDPRSLPWAVQNACAMVIRNYLARGGGTSGLTAISGVGRVNTVFDKSLIDSNVQDLLRSYRTVRCM